jgi:hypothetical protein
MEEELSEEATTEFFSVVQKEGNREVGRKLSRYEQETVINFNAGEDIATLYTRDKAVTRKGLTNS